MTTSTLRLALVFGFVLVAPRPTLADYNDNNFDAERGWVRTVETGSIDLAPINSCAGYEEVDVTGPYTITTKTLMDAGNFTYIKQQVQISASGVGLVSGATYLFDVFQTSRVKTHNPLPATFILHETDILYGQGIVPSQKAQIYIKAHINPNGSTVSDIFQLTVDCP
jgi:hypothetical protein